MPAARPDPPITHRIIRTREQPRAAVREAAAHSWPPVEPMVLRWKSVPDLDPAMLRSEKPKRAKPAEDVMPELSAWSGEQFVEEFLSEQPLTRSDIRERATGKPGPSWRWVSDFLDIAKHRGLIDRVKLPGQGGPVGFARRDNEASP